MPPYLSSNNAAVSMLVLLRSGGVLAICCGPHELDDGVPSREMTPPLIGGAVARCCNFLLLLSAEGVHPTPAAASQGAFRRPPDRRSIMSHAIFFFRTMFFPENYSV